ncbi:MAG: hypothetical protein HY527_21700 [Betaproteobacteria bacterium]|nr:hypothetical protein [Betaproteobacteria bacterium]
MVLFGAAVAYYSFDDELSPDARALLAAPKLGEPTDANGYVAFLGMGAPSGHDQMAWGRKVLAALRAQDADGFKKDAAWEGTVKPQLGFSKDVPWCWPEKQFCLALAREKGEALARLLEDNRKMLARYRTMRDKPVFDDAYLSPRADAWFPPYQLIPNSHSLALLTVIRQAAAGDLDGAIGELERETAFHGRFAASARYLIGKSVAAVLIARDALVLSDLIATSKGGIAPYGARIEAMTRRLEADLTLREAPLTWEIYVSATQAMELRRRPPYGSPDAPGNVLIDTLGALIYRPNASVNALVASHQEQLAILGKGPLNFDQALAKAEEATRRLESPSWIDVLRNPVGSLLLSLSPLSYGEFFARAYNVAGLLRLVALQAAVVARGIESPEAIAQFLASEAAKPYADPFTGKPMAWDGASRQLYFQPRGRGAGWIEALKTRYQGRIAVTL